MQTLHRLRRFRDLRAVSSGAQPPADGVPSPALAAPDQEARPAFPNPSWPTFAVGLRLAVSATLAGTGPESGAVPRGRPRQRAIRFRLSLERARLPYRVCRATLVRQTSSMSACLAVYMSDRRHGPLPGSLPGGRAACLPSCTLACRTGWQGAYMPVYMSACLHTWQSACLCPSPDR